jgi:hypothetical protein
MRRAPGGVAGRGRAPLSLSLMAAPFRASGAERGHRRTARRRPERQSSAWGDAPLGASSALRAGSDLQAEVPFGENCDRAHATARVTMFRAHEGHGGLVTEHREDEGPHATTKIRRRMPRCSASARASSMRGPRPRPDPRTSRAPVNAATTQDVGWGLKFSRPTAGGGRPVPPGLPVRRTRSRSTGRC